MKVKQINETIERDDWDFNCNEYVEREEAARVRNENAFAARRFLSLLENSTYPWEREN